MGLTEVQRLRRRLGAGWGACLVEQGPLGAHPASRGGAEKTGAWWAEGLHELYVKRDDFIILGLLEYTVAFIIVV